MKSLIIIFIFILNAYNSPAQSWYKVFTGKMGNMSATLHLHKSADSYNGYIWFDQNQWPMPIYGSAQTAGKDSVSISATSGPLSVNLTGILNNENFKGYGNLQKENMGSKKASFQFNANNNGTFTPFDYFFVEGHASLPATLKNQSTCDYSAAMIWPKENNSLSTSLKKEISVLLESKTLLSNPQVWMNNEKNKFIAAWQKDNNKLTPKEASEMGLSLSASQNNNIMVMYENDRTITLADFVSVYSGGAHNNYSTALLTFNKKNGSVLRLTDVLTAEGIKLLPTYLDRVARLQYGITNQKPLDENNFFVKKINPSKNFYLTTSGIGFLYAPYEIKSFADGEINLLIPFSALNKYLQPGFKN